MSNADASRRERVLTDVFGPGESLAPEQRALESKRIYVRGLDLLTLDTRPEATGRRLTASEAYAAYGIQVLHEVAAEGSAIIASGANAAGRVLRERREQLGLPLRSVASKAGLTVPQVEALEQSRRRPIREYERAARVLGLDERKISYQAVPTGNEALAVRLRTVADARGTMSPASVIGLSEAMWVAMTQIRLEELLGSLKPRWTFETTDEYGGSGMPAYQAGYDLASHFRTVAGLGVLPIESMRELVESSLGIPVVHVELDQEIAGATIEHDGRRAIVLNVGGLNRSALVRRSTLAHEIGHLLFDPSQQLEELRVDEYAEINERADRRADPVEQRANAFSVQLLAPQDAAVRRYATDQDLFTSVIDYFGISFTAGRYQVWNGMNRSIGLDTISAPNRAPEPDWEGREGYTLTYHPIRQLDSHPSRAGRFSAVALCSAAKELISWDTAAEWLYCSESDAREAVSTVADLYPEVFSNAGLADGQS